MKNWKTTLAGVLAVMVGVAHTLWPTIITIEVTGAINTILIAAGLIAAKDGNVTGGTVAQ